MRERERERRLGNKSNKGERKTDFDRHINKKESRQTII